MTDHEIRRALGIELRTRRDEHGWTRAELAERTLGTVSARALEAYETGDRQVTVGTLLRLGTALGVRADVVLAAVIRRVRMPEALDLRVDLHALAYGPAEDLLPLRRWAALHLSMLTSADPPYVYLPPAAVSALAQLCQVDVEELLHLVGAATSSGEQP